MKETIDFVWIDAENQNKFLREISQTIQGFINVSENTDDAINYYVYFPLINRLFDFREQFILRMRALGKFKNRLEMDKAGVSGRR